MKILLKTQFFQIHSTVFRKGKTKKPIKTKHRLTATKKWFLINLPWFKYTQNKQTKKK